MALDPQVKALLDQMAAAKQPAFHSQTPADARKSMNAGQFSRRAAEHTELAAKSICPFPHSGGDDLRVNSGTVVPDS